MTENIDWGNALNWGWAAPIYVNSFGGARDIPDAITGTSGNFKPTAQNQQLLASLGYGGAMLGPGVSDSFGAEGYFPAPEDAWSSDALSWLNSQGYSLGVGHQPGTKEGGRAEFWGLLDPSGKYVSGQSTPTQTISDTLMDQIAPFALMAGPFLNAAGVIGAAGGAGAGGLSAIESGVAPLGASWSPEALGLTGSIGSGATAADMAWLSQALPSIGEVGAGLGAAGGLGAVGGIETLPAVTVTGSSAGGAGATGAIGGSAATGGSVSFLDDLFQKAADDALATSGNYYQQNPFQQWMTDVGNVAEIKGGGLLDYLSSANQNLPSLSTGNQTVDNIIKNTVGGSSSATGGNALGSILGGLLGAATSKSGETTQSRAPWEAAQPYLKGLLGDAETMRANLAQNPFTPQQTQAYQNAYSGLDQSRAALPGLMNWGQTAMQSKSNVPSYDQLFSQVKPR